MPVLELFPAVEPDEAARLQIWTPFDRDIRAEYITSTKGWLAKLALLKAADAHNPTVDGTLEKAELAIKDIEEIEAADPMDLPIALVAHIMSGMGDAQYEKLEIVHGPTSIAICDLDDDGNFEYVGEQATSDALRDISGFDVFTKLMRRGKINFIASFIEPLDGGSFVRMHSLGLRIAKDIYTQKLPPFTQDNIDTEIHAAEVAKLELQFLT